VFVWTMTTAHCAHPCHPSLVVPASRRSRWLVKTASTCRRPGALRASGETCVAELC
jgi:hypothetical protein